MKTSPGVLGYSGGNSQPGANGNTGPTPKAQILTVLGDVLSKAYWVAMIVSATSLPAFIADSLNWGLISGFATFLFGTLPFTLAVATIAVLTMSGRLPFNMKDPKSSLLDVALGWIVPSILIFMLLTWLGSLLNLGAAREVQGIMDRWHYTGELAIPIIGPILRYALAYLQVYGAWTFICCFVAAGFIAWTIVARLLPLLRTGKSQSNI